MKKPSIKLALLIFLCTASAQASDAMDLDVPTDSTYLAELQKTFDSSNSLPTLTELTGWFTGRCYFASAPDRAYGALSVGRTVKVGSEHGPLFPARDVFKVYGIIQSSSRPADYCDAMSPDKEREMEEFIERNDSGVGEVIVQATSVSFSFGGTSQVSLRKSPEGYLMLKIQKNSEKSAHGYCYYFKKVK